MTLRSAMARAAAVQARHGGDMVTYQPEEGGPPVEGVPVIFGQAEEPDGSASRSRVLRRRTIIITADALGPMVRPKRGDLVGFGTEGGWAVANARLDETGIRYIVALTRQD